LFETDYIFNRVVRALQSQKRLIFPAILVICNLGSAVACFASGDWKRGLYWMASSVCIASVSVWNVRSTAEDQAPASLRPDSVRLHEMLFLPSENTVRLRRNSQNRSRSPLFDASNGLLGFTWVFFESGLSW